VSTDRRTNSNETDRGTAERTESANEMDLSMDDLALVIGYIKDDDQSVELLLKGLQPVLSFVDALERENLDAHQAKLLESM
jgi:hypothetical protein